MVRARTGRSVMRAASCVAESIRRSGRRVAWTVACGSGSVGVGPGVGCGGAWQGPRLSPVWVVVRQSGLELEGVDIGHSTQCEGAGLASTRSGP